MLPVVGQNLMLNPGFEDLNNCREHHADCAMEAWFNIPAAPPRINMRWAPRPMLGHNLLVLNMENLVRPVKLRSYVYTVLPCPLVAGEQYLLDFFLYTGKLPFERLDLSFLSEEPTLDAIQFKRPTPSITLGPAQVQAEMKGHGINIHRPWERAIPVIGQFIGSTIAVSFGESNEQPGRCVLFSG
jgi:hypothetical protein